MGYKISVYSLSNEELLSLEDEEEKSVISKCNFFDFLSIFCRLYVFFAVDDDSFCYASTVSTLYNNVQVCIDMPLTQIRKMEFK